MTAYWVATRDRAVPAERARRAGHRGRGAPASTRSTSATTSSPGGSRATPARPGSLLGAIGQATERIGLGTGVTAPGAPLPPRGRGAVRRDAAGALPRARLPRDRLGRVAERVALRAWTGRTPASRCAAMEEALEIIDRLLDGERVDHDGRFFRTKGAYLHTRGRARPPIYVSAFGPDAAGVAARFGDGLWTLADPEIGARADRRLQARARGGRQGAAARSSSRPASPGHATTTPRSRARASGRRPSRTSTSPTTGTTPGHVREGRAARSPTRSSGSRTSSARTPSSTSSGSARSSSSAPRSSASRTLRGPTRSVPSAYTPSTSCRRCPRSSDQALRTGDECSLYGHLFRGARTATRRLGARQVRVRGTSCGRPGRTGRAPDLASVYHNRRRSTHGSCARSPSELRALARRRSATEPRRRRPSGSS